jgi:hypothetical protein
MPSLVLVIRLVRPFTLLFSRPLGPQNIRPEILYLLLAIIKIGRISQTQLVNVLLLRSFIHMAYLRSNYMFRLFSLGHIFTRCARLTLPIFMTVCSTRGMAHLKLCLPVPDSNIQFVPYIFVPAQSAMLAVPV